MDLISVIVPVFKVEAYLEKCVESITNQTYKNLEIILVDDGSPDNCPQICDSCAQKDKRIKVVHQNNSGAGKARNKALDIAKGDFIAFVDSDDYLSPYMMEFLHGLFSEKVDIVECGYCTTKNNMADFDDISQPYHEKRVGNIDAMRANISDTFFRQLIWNKLYRKSVIANIRFPEGKKIDDEFWTYQVIGNARSLVSTDKVLYAYRQQESSVMHLLTKKSRLQAIEAKMQRHAYITTNMPEIVFDSALNLWLSCIYQGQLLLKEPKDDENDKIWTDLKTCLNQCPLKCKGKNIPLNLKIWILLANISFKNTCKIRNLLKIGM